MRHWLIFGIGVGSVVVYLRRMRRKMEVYETENTPPSSTESFICLICYYRRHESERVSVDCCEKSSQTCRKCVRQVIANYFHSPAGTDDLRCPFAQCREPIPSETMRTIWGNDEDFDHQYTLRAIQSLGGIRCPECTVPILPPTSVCADQRCPYCDADICGRCLDRVGEGCGCRLLDWAQKAVDTGVVSKDGNGRDDLVRRCPGLECGAFCQKIDACPWVRCEVCEQVFNWTHARPIVQSDRSGEKRR